MTTGSTPPQLLHPDVGRARAGVGWGGGLTAVAVGVGKILLDIAATDWCTTESTVSRLGLEGWVKQVPPILRRVLLSSAGELHQHSFSPEAEEQMCSEHLLTLRSIPSAAQDLCTGWSNGCLSLSWHNHLE